MWEGRIVSTTYEQKILEEIFHAKYFSRLHESAGFWTQKEGGAGGKISFLDFQHLFWGTVFSGNTQGNSQENITVFQLYRRQ